MKEYIVGFADDTNIERFERTYGTNGELVRCKDCKRYPYQEINADNSFCIVYYEHCKNMKDYDYCSKGEAK